MIHDKINLLLQDIGKHRENLKGLKKDMRQLEVVDNEDYRNLKKSVKDLRSQIKDMEEEWQEDLHSDDHYNQLRELRMKAEEDLALDFEKLNLELAKLPAKPFDMNIDTESGPVRVQIQPEMKVYVNGKEEKRKI